MANRPPRPSAASTGTASTAAAAAAEGHPAPGRPHRSAGRRRRRTPSDTPPPPTTRFPAADGTDPLIATDAAPVIATEADPVNAISTSPGVPNGTGPVGAIGTCPVVAIGTCPVVAIGTCPVVAIGDVHGCASLLMQELEKHEGSGAELILLGDLIDRSPEADGDRRVLELVWLLQANPGLWGLAGVTVLRGNHEQMLIDALAEDKPGDATELWAWNGGDTDLLEFYRPRRAWFEALPRTAIRGDYLFVHAGVRPGVPLERQRDDDLIWIRRPFLNRPHGLPYTVVHGHSITRHHRIDRRADRINLDTGAFTSGVLSSLRLDP